MIPVLTVGEVVIGQVGAGHAEFVVDAIQLHVLEAPAFIDTIWDEFLSETSQVRSVVHAYLNAVHAKVGNQGCEQGST